MDTAPDALLQHNSSSQPRPSSPQLGKAFPGCEVTIDTLSLVVQNGPEPLWDWRPVGAARLLGARHNTT